MGMQDQISFIICGNTICHLDLSFSREFFNESSMEYFCLFNNILVFYNQKLFKPECTPQETSIFHQRDLCTQKDPMKKCVT